MVRCSLCVVVIGLSLSPVSAQTLPRVADLLDSVPPTVPLSEAYGVALVPAGHGPNPQGVFLVKAGAEWRDPEFVTLHIWAKPVAHEPRDYVILFPTRRSLERALNEVGSLGADVIAYARARGSFVKVSLEGAALRPAVSFRGLAEREQAVALKEQFTALAAPKSVTEAKAAVPKLSWELLVEHPEILVCGFGALGAWLATTKKRKR
ncbi:MAG TPA: hypothetical protein VGE74_00645 [Gemmata sp.]